MFIWSIAIVKHWKIVHQKPISLPSDDGVLPSQEEFKRETTDYWNQNFKQSEVASSGVKATSKGYCQYFGTFLFVVILSMKDF